MPNRPVGKTLKIHVCHASRGTVMYDSSASPAPKMATHATTLRSRRIKNGISSRTGYTLMKIAIESAAAVTTSLPPPFSRALIQAKTIAAVAMIFT